MNHALKIDEIVSAIVYHVSQLPKEEANHTLYSLSQTSRAWSQYALDYLWKDLTMEKHFSLAATMSPNSWELSAEKNSGMPIVSMRKNTHIDWISQCFMAYANRVRSIWLQLHPTTSSLSWKVVDDSVYIAWSNYWIGLKKQVFPNLYHLNVSIHVLPHLSPPAISSLMTFARTLLDQPGTSTLTVTFTPDILLDTKPYINALSHGCGNLEKFAYYGPIDSRDTSLVHFFQKQRRIREFKSRKEVPESILAMLSQSVCLETLALGQQREYRIPTGFSNLRCLYLNSSDLERLCRVLRESLTTTQLVSLKCAVDTIPTINPLPSLSIALARHSSLSEIYILPCIRSWQCCTVPFQDLTQFAASLPSQLNTLSIPLIAPYHSEQSRLKSDTGAFVVACPPSLRYIRFSTRAMAPALSTHTFIALTRRFESTVTNTPIGKLDVGGSNAEDLIDAAEDTNGPVRKNPIAIEFYGNPGPLVNLRLFAQALLKVFPSLILCSEGENQYVHKDWYKTFQGYLTEEKSKS